MGGRDGGAAAAPTLPPLSQYLSLPPGSSPLVLPLQYYLAGLGDAGVNEGLLARFREATNMTDEISALAALDKAGELERSVCF